MKWFGFSELIQPSLNHIASKILNTYRMLILRVVLKSQRFSFPHKLQTSEHVNSGTSEVPGSFEGNSYHFQCRCFWGREGRYHLLMLSLIHSLNSKFHEGRNHDSFILIKPFIWEYFQIYRKVAKIVQRIPLLLPQLPLKLVSYTMSFKIFCVNLKPRPSPSWTWGSITQTPVQTQFSYFLHLLKEEWGFKPSSHWLQSLFIFPTTSYHVTWETVPFGEA